MFTAFERDRFLLINFKNFAQKNGELKTLTDKILQDAENSSHLHAAHKQLEQEAHAFPEIRKTLLLWAIGA